MSEQTPYYHNTRKTYYHYTNLEGAEGIQAAGCINPSKTTDGIFGRGVYLNRMAPNNDPEDVAKNNYDRNWQQLKDRVGVAIEMQLPATLPNRLNLTDRDVYFVPKSKILLTDTKRVVFHQLKIP
ncbi:hypothetical protein LOTGIDRAFT_165383 [Lottia gigantea]|uniref:Tox-ART-HYD1 domain-containing protein n=1 Tax=Lottia gigantea TaxID=225164 RepID=V4BIX1_LOTGI|nr:hypothetical protein LOTGIDRAFT_165383 [Lottia gigantea]ESO88599.1 hypothetical protein LOTGIDRAFT_165383 [Lottia gigantea]